MSVVNTANFTLHPQDGWVQIGSAAGSFLRIDHFPAHVPIFVTVATSPPSLVSTNATGTITFSGLPTAGQTVTVDDVIYTFVTTANNTKNTVVIGTTAALTAANLAALISSRATATVSGSVVTVTATAQGYIGNTYPLATNATNVTVSGSTLTGGVTANTGFRIECASCHFDGGYTGNLYARISGNSNHDVKVSVWTNPNASSGGGGGGGTTYSQNSINYVATASGTGYSTGDYITKVVTSDQTGSAGVEAVYWLDLTTGAQLSTAPSLSNLALVPIGSVTIAAGSALIGSVNLDIGGTAVSASNPVYEADAYTAPSAVTWTSATAVNTANTVTTTGYDGVLISVITAAGITGGVLTFEAYDGAAWIPAQAGKLNAYGGSTTVTLGASQTQGYQINIAGATQFRTRLSTAITGTGNVVVTHLASSAPMPDPLTVGLDPAQPLPPGTNLMGKVGIDQTTPGTTNAVSATNLPTTVAVNKGVPTASTLLVVEAQSATPTLTQVAASASSTTLLAANTARMGATIVNASSSILYVAFGATASATAYTVALGPTGTVGAYYEVPFNYRGQITGIWATATGNAVITEVT